MTDTFFKIPEVKEQADKLKLSYSDIERYIEEADSAQEKIFNKYKEANEGEFYKRRWFWELLQNALDTIDKDDDRIKIELKVVNKYDHFELIFEHGGGYFKPAQEWNKRHEFKNFILAKSGKTLSDDKVGKFGTGFLSTHCLSDEIKIEGICIDASGEKVFRDIKIDRAEFKDEDNASIQIRTLKIIKSLFDYDNEYKKLNGNEKSAKFTYKVKKENIKTVDAGIREILFSIPYVFAFSNKIESLEIEYDFGDDKGNKVKIKTCGESEFNGYKLYKTQFKYSNIDMPEDCFIATLSEGNTTIAWKVKKDNEKLVFLDERKTYMESFGVQMNSLFCQYPLIGSHKFIFPVIINSKDFRPEDKRQGINLIESNTTNKDIITKAIELYKKYLLQASNNGLSIYNIIETKYEAGLESWIDETWYKAQIDKVREIISTTRIIDISDSVEDRKAILDLESKVQIFFPNQKCEREEIDRQEFESTYYSFVEKIFPKQVPLVNDINSWLEALWKDKIIKIIDIKELIKEISASKNLEGFSNYFITDKPSDYNYKDELDWLSRLYRFIIDDIKDRSLFNFRGGYDEFGIVLSRSLNFKILDKLKKDVGFEKETINDEILKLYEIFYPKNTPYQDKLLLNQYNEIFDLKEENGIRESDIANEILKQAEKLINEHDDILKDSEKIELSKEKKQLKNEIEDKLSQLHNWIAKYNKNRKYFSDYNKRKILQAIIDEKESENITTLLEMHRAGVTLNDQVKLLKDPDLDEKLKMGKKFVEARREKEQRDKNNRSVGEHFQKLFAKILEQEGINFLPEDGEQDFIISPDTENQVYVELKSISASKYDVKLTPEQAKKMVEKKAKYFLCVIPINGDPFQYTEDDFRKNTKFNNELHELVMQKLENTVAVLKDEYGVSGVFPTEILEKFDEKPIKYRVSKENWDLKDINDFLSYIRQ